MPELPVSSSVASQTRSYTDSTGVFRLLATRGDDERSSGTEIDCGVQVSVNLQSTGVAAICPIGKRQLLFLVSATTTGLAGRKEPIRLCERDPPAFCFVFEHCEKA